MNLDTTNHLENVRKAAANLNGVLRTTDMIYSEFFSKETGNRIYIKPENLQRTGSFKIRGAFNKVANLTEEERAKGIIASSAGNHAQGVALAASKMGIKATIVMPQVTPLIKIDSTKSYGADVVLHGNVYDEAYAKAVELAEANGYTFVHPYNDYDVMCGQGTIALEILEELEDIDQILVPVGGGGLISGIAMAAKAIKPTIQVIGVEPVGAASMTAALDAGLYMEQTVAEELVKELKKRKLHISTAESCTGGMIASTIVSVSGASQVLEECYVTYSNRVKKKLLHVQEETLKQYTEVSAQTASEMAEGIVQATGAEVGISVTGYAGPDGGEDGTCAGTVYIGTCLNGKAKTKKFVFAGDRMAVREQATKEALLFAWERITSNE